MSDERAYSKYEQTRSSTRPVMRGTIGMVFLENAYIK